MADWGKAQNCFMRAAFLIIQMLDGFDTTSDNVKGLLPKLISYAGFKEVQESDRCMSPFGTLSLLSAKKPE